MAQQSKKSRVESLAERLFVAQWQPNGGRTAEHLAQQCMKAAEEFYDAQKPKSQAA